MADRMGVAGPRLREYLRDLEQMCYLQGLVFDNKGSASFMVARPPAGRFTA